MKRAIAVIMLMLTAVLPFGAGCSTSGAPADVSGAAASDKDIVDDVIDRLRQDPVTYRYPFSIASDEGVVTIGGIVGYEDARLRAISIVRGAPGVKGVVDNITR